MMSTDESDGLAPLNQAMRRLEIAIDEHLAKVAALRKRHAAIQAAIDVLRSSDEDLVGVELSKTFHPTTKRRVVDFDEVVVEAKVLEVLDGGRLKVVDIRKHLENAAISYSLSGLKRILATCPKIIRTGERDQTRYHLVGGK